MIKQKSVLTFMIVFVYKVRNRAQFKKPDLFKVTKRHIARSNRITNCMHNNSIFNYLRFLKPQQHSNMAANVQTIWTSTIVAAKRVIKTKIF